MKRLAMGLMAAALALNIVPLDGTLSFLTSEKKQVSPVSTGTNEDVFVTDANRIDLKTKVEKRTKITRKVNADGSSSETKDSRLSVLEGSQVISFTPKRPHLDLDVENMTVTGDAASEVVVERLATDKEISFRISHSRKSAWDKRKSETEKGELRVTALGGFYSLSIPLTISTSYRESTDLTEEAAPNPSTPGTSDTPSTPDTPTTPAPGGNTTEPAQPPSAGEETPATPPTDSSGPAPPSTPDTGTDPPVTDTQEGTPSGSPSTPDDPPASDSARQ
ncbi:hypothetical protein [Brevibacillus choshinensis]|uniref:Uncharacterized protein n=1 Tax=Brevibacillus choshinensis TaxID=54911 RepID=A0ABX7FT21_BRECH|nr:hypothetical protein [Brevibacillus choshinensis]QRG68110.1 hypothetical protein JNE38_02555 [Brevibacillus choshinensis]